MKKPTKVEWDAVLRDVWNDGREYAVEHPVGAEPNRVCPYRKGTDCRDAWWNGYKNKPLTTQT